MANYVTTVVNESDSDVGLKLRNAGVVLPLATLEARGGSHSIEVDPQAMYRDYMVTAPDVSFSSVIYANDCVESERICIRNSSVDSTLELARMKRGMYVTEVVNFTARCFNVCIEVSCGNLEVGVLGEQGTYLIQVNPKDKSNPLFSLMEGDHSPFQFPFQDLVKNQMIQISETDAGLAAIHVPRSWYLMEVRNKTSSVFKVKRGQGGKVSAVDMELATLQEGKSFIIENDPAGKRVKYWVESAGQVLPINSKDFVKFQRMNIVHDNSSQESFKLQSVPRSAPVLVAKKGWVSKFSEVLGF